MLPDTVRAANFSGTALLMDQPELAGPETPILAGFPCSFIVRGFYFIFLCLSLLICPFFLSFFLFQEF